MFSLLSAPSFDEVVPEIFALHPEVVNRRHLYNIYYVNLIKVMESSLKRPSLLSGCGVFRELEPFENLVTDSFMYVFLNVNDTMCTLGAWE